MVHPAVYNIDPAVNTFVMFATLQHDSQLYKKLTYRVSIYFSNSNLRRS